MDVTWRVVRCWDTGASLSGFEHQWQGRPWTSDLISLIYKGADDANSIATLWLDMWLVIITPRPVPGTQWTPYQCLLNDPSVSLPFLKSSFAPFCAIAYATSSSLTVFLLAEMSPSRQAPCRCSCLHRVLLGLPPHLPGLDDTSLCALVASVSLDCTEDMCHY